jgi:hypothetical protein
MGPDAREFVVNMTDTLMLLTGVDPEESWLPIRIDDILGTHVVIQMDTEADVDQHQSFHVAVGDTIRINLVPAWAEAMDVDRPVIVEVVRIDGAATLAVDPATPRDHIVRGKGW